MSLLRALTLMAAVVLAHPAFAHSKMAKSTPAQGTTVAAGLSDIKLAFKKPVRVTLVEVERETDGAGIPVKLSGARGFASNIPIEVAPLQPGGYKVTWTAVSKDGHVMKGSLSFQVSAD